jgi:hypothetical protein
MKSWAKWTAKTVLVTTGFAAAGGGFAGVAHAADVPVSIPVNICGNAAAVLGIATAGCQGGAEVVAHQVPVGRPGSPERGSRTGNLSVGSGNTVEIPVRVGVNACGNAIGAGQASCRGGVFLPGGDSSGGDSSGGDGPIKHAGLSAGNITVGSGNDIQVPVTAPVNVCGNAAGVLGGSSAGCEGGASVGGHRLLSSAQLASFGALPGLSNLGGVTDLPVLQELTSGASLLPASALSALTSNVDAGGMSANSYATLAIGALLAGAAALKLAGRRSRARKASAGEVSA